MSAVHDFFVRLMPKFGQRIVNHLTPLDQVRLLQYLIPRIALDVEAFHSADSSRATAWQEFFRIGDEIAAGDRPDGDTLTATLLAMRR